MLRSRLPVPSVLGLFAALLMLSPELLLGIPEGVFDIPVTDLRVQISFSFAVEQYNHHTRCSANYVKMLRVLKAQSQVGRRNEYDLTVELVETTCKKTPGRFLSYSRIQKCEQLPGIQEKLTCYFIVLHYAALRLKTATCT